MDHKRKIIKIDVSGRDQTLFNKLKDKLVIAVDKFLDSVIDSETGATVKEETKKLTSLALNFAEEKLKKAGIENQLLIADIEEKYSRVEKNKADARKIDAETKKMIFDQSLRELSLSLRLTKALILGKEGEEAIILIKQIDTFLEAIQEVNQSQRLLS